MLIYITHLIPHVNDWVGVSIFMQILINGTIQGLLISLLAIGFSIVYNSTGIIYVAQGRHLCHFSLPAPFFPKIWNGNPIRRLLTFAITVFLSMSFEKINHWPLYKKRRPL